MDNRNPKFSERNEIIWLDKKFAKNQKLICKRPMCISSHWKIALAVGVCIVLFAIVVSAFASIHWRISMMSVLIVMVSAVLADVFFEFRRYKQYYRGIIQDGGDIIDPYNAKLLGGATHGMKVLLISWSLLIYGFLGVILYSFITGANTISDLLVPFVMIFIIPIQIISLQRSFCGPFIFMGLDKGMVFGGNVYSYASLYGFLPVGEGNGFELYYNDKVVAKGRMLPDDRLHLLKILEVHKKYFEVGRE